jgi:hypothetical protein
MTAPKGTKQQGCASGVLARKPLCNMMLACDGNTLTANRKEKGYCGKCETALAKRSKPAPPLRGENTALYEAHRRQNTDSTRGWDANGSPVEDR